MGEKHDWKQLGLKAGLEIHQQVGRPGDTKLFCHCPAEIVEREPDLTITRMLRASAGETGAVDVAAAAEQAKQKRFTYQAFNDTACLVELDEEPPHPINQEVVTTTVMVAKALGSTILKRVQIMRKTIVDGSNVSGFQRTGLVAIGGKIPGTDVRIQTVAIEEDAAKIVSRSTDGDVYNLSRLGIPLMEIATEPDMKTPDEVKETAAQLGMILRSTKRVKRGLGTIRQDVNVSIEGGTRIEIKGAQDLRMIPKLVENEAKRQQSLIELKNTDIETSEPVDVTELFAGSDVGFIKTALKDGAKAFGIRIDDFKGLLGKELCPGYRLGTEIAGHVKSRGFGGIIHSDEKLGTYGVGDKELELKRRFNCKDNDGFLILIGDETGTLSTLTEVVIPRLHALKGGVPKEVRKANDDGTTSYLRPMPGGARMYPETDIPLVEVQPEGIESPRLITEQIDDVAKKTGLSKDLATTIVKEDVPVESLKEKHHDLSYGFLVKALVTWPKEVESRLNTIIPDPGAYLRELLPDVASGKLTEAAVKSVLEKIGEHNKNSQTPLAPDMVRSLMEDIGDRLSEQDLRKIVEDVVAKNPGLSQGAYMGDVMKEARGKADGKAVMKILTEVLK